MEKSISNAIERCLQESFSGTKNFGQVVAALIEIGVESYHADYRHASTTYYMPDGKTKVLTLDTPEHVIPQAFDASALQAAIRGAQRGEVIYPEFLTLSMAAGCVGYIVWIEGKHVAYFGHRGEIHIERFPS